MIVDLSRSNILVRTLRFVSSARINPDQGKASYATMERSEPQFEKYLLASLDARRVNSDFARLLAYGVRKAGAAISDAQVAAL